MPLNTLSGELKNSWDNVKTTYNNFVKMFGDEAANRYVVKCSINNELKYTQEYLNTFCSNSGNKCIYESLLLNDHRIHDGIIEYLLNDGNKNIVEEITFLIDDADNAISDGAYHASYDANDICRSIFETDILKKIAPVSQENALNIAIHLLNSKTMTFAMKYSDSVCTSVIDYVMKYSPNVLDYVDTFKTKFPQYQGYPLILLNTNIDREKRIKVIKKTFIQKYITKYIKSMRDIDDYNMLDDFIEAVVFQNNRVKEKGNACRDVLERFLIGMHGERYEFDANMLKKKNFNTFYEKYKTYLTPAYLNNIYNNRWTSKNESIKNYFSAICSLEKDVGKRLDMIREGSKMSDTLFSGLLGDLHKEYGANLENLDDETTLKIVRASISLKRSETIYLWDGPYRIFDMTTIQVANERPAVFDSLLREAKYKSRRTSSYYWVEPYRHDDDLSIFNYRKLTADNMAKLRLFTSEQMSAIFIPKNLKDDKMPNIVGNTTLFAANFYLYLLNGDCPVSMQTEAGREFYRYYVEPFILDDVHKQDVLTSLIAVINSNEFTKYFGKLSNNTPYIDVLASLFDSIMKLGTCILSESEQEALNDSLTYIKESVSLLAGMK